MTVFPTRKHPRDLLDSIWRASGSASTTVVLIMLLIITLLVIALIPGAGSELSLVQQSSTHVLDSSTSQTAVKIGYVALSVWLKALLAAIGFISLLRLADQVLGASRIFRRGCYPPCPPQVMPERHVVGEELGPAAKQTEHGLKSSWPEVRCERQPARVRFFATRRRWKAIDGILIEIGPLMVLLGLAVNSAAGWHFTSIALPPEGPVSLQGSASTTLSLNGIANDGSDVTAVILASTGQNVATEQLITNHRPGRWGNLWVTLQATGPALIVNASDVSNRPLLLQSLVGSSEIGETLKVLFRTTQTEQAFSIPTRNLAFRVVSYPELPDRGLYAPVFLVEAYRADSVTPILSELVTDAAEFNIDDTRITLAREHFALVDSAYLPGVVPMLSGAILLLVGLVIRVIWPLRSVWLDLVEHGSTTAIFVRSMSCDAKAKADGLCASLISEDAAPERDRSHAD